MEKDKTEFRKQRLKDAASKAGGKAALGKSLGYQDGSLVGQMIRGERPITEATIEKIESMAGYESWFTQAGYWPFTPEMYAAVVRLSDEDLLFAENALRAHLRMPPIPIPGQGNSLGGDGSGESSQHAA